MDGRLVLLALIVVIAAIAASSMEPVRSPGIERAELARERAADAVLVEIDRTQLCYRRRRERYADSIPSLQLARGRFMRTALTHDLDISMRTAPDGQSYSVRVAGVDVDALLERRGNELVRLEVGERPRPRVVGGCAF